MNIRLKKWNVQGEERWVVEWTSGRQRNRRYFPSKRAAESERKHLEQQFAETGDLWLGLSSVERGEILAVWHEVRTQGLTLREVWEDYKRRPVTTATVRRTLHTAIDEVIQAKTQAKRRQRYVDSLRAYLDKFAQGREDLPADRITATDLEQWFAHRKEAAPTQASNLGRLSALFSFCVRKGYCSKNPCDSVERVSADRRPPPILSAEEARAGRSQPPASRNCSNPLAAPTHRLPEGDCIFADRCRFAARSGQTIPPRCGSSTVAGIRQMRPS